MRPRVAWALFVAGGIAADLWRTRVADGSTFSQATRDAFCTNTRLGRIAFIASWGYLCAWFPAHVLEHPADREQRKIEADFARIAGE